MKEEIYRLIENNDLEKAIKHFLEITRGNSQFYQIAITLNTSYQEYQMENLKAFDTRGKRNEIVSRLMTALEKFQPEESKENNIITKTIHVPTSGNFKFSQTISNDGISINREIQEEENQNRNTQKVEKLKKQIIEIEELIEEWEDKRRVAENPNERLRSEKEIEKLEQILEEYEEKLNKLESKILSNDSTSIQDNQNTIIQGTSESNINIGNTKQKNKKILFLYASPNNAKTLNFEKEIEAIRTELAKSPEKENYQIEVRGKVKALDLKDIIEDRNPDILHISLHAHQEKGLLFEDKNGAEHSINASKTARIFKRLKTTQKVPKILILNACESHEVAQSCSEFVSYVIGMQDFMPDKASEVFSQKFYNEVFENKDVKSAILDAKDAIDLLKISEGELKANNIKHELFDIPILFENGTKTELS